jgi:hypothetical protein
LVRPAERVRLDEVRHRDEGQPRHLGERLDGLGQGRHSITHVGAQRDDHPSATLPTDLDPDVGDRDPDRRLRFVDDDIDGFNPRKAQDIGGDDLGERLDEVEGRPLDAGQHLSSNLAVVNRVDEVVRAPRPTQVQLDGNVDEELLPVARSCSNTP